MLYEVLLSGRVSRADSMLPFEEQLDHLKFPTLPIDNSLAYYLSRSTLVSMASNPDHPSEDTTSSLGDSTYEILSESTFFTSEDEDHEDNADWVASNEQDPTDDLASLADTDDSKQAQEEDFSGRDVLCRNASAPGDVDRETEDDEGESSTITTRDRNHVPVQSIEFEEAQPYRDAEQVDAIHTVYKFSHEEAFKIGADAFSNGESVQYVATIRQAMTRQGLVLDRPFRIVYIGDCSAQTVVVEKMGAALAVPSSWGPASHAAHRRSSHFNIIPVSSFGDNTSPEVELIDSSGLEIVVDRCTFAEFTEGEGSHSNITLTLNESTICQSTRDRRGFKVESDSYWQLPDVAIIYRSNGDDARACRTRTIAHLFMRKHNVPSIIISDAPLWDNPNIPAMLPSKAPHLCLEARGVNVSDNRVLRRLPIDLASFRNIDSGQMNRNLACLTGLYSGKDLQPKERDHRTSRVGAKSPIEDLGKAAYASWLAQKVSRLRGITRSDVRAMVLIGALFIYTIAYTFTPIGYFKPAQSPPSQQTASLSVTTRVSPVSSAFSSSSTALALAPSNSAISSPVVWEAEDSNLKTVSVRNTNMDLANLRLDPSVISLNESNRFKIQVVGDCHIVLRPPQSLTPRKSTPKISVKVTRNEVILEHELSKLFENVYAVKLNRDDAYGPMNVSVWTRSKPTFNQTVVVDFGTPWLKTRGWKKVVEVMSAQIRNEYNTRLCKLRGMFARRGDSMLGITRRATSKTAAVPGEATTTKITSPQRISRTKEKVLLRIKVLSSLVSRQAIVHSKQLVKESVRLSKKSQLLSQRIRGDLGSQTRDITAVGARYLTTLCNAATGVDPAKLWVELSKLPPVHYKQSLRPVQKTVLQMWRRLSGVRARRAERAEKSRSSDSPPKVRKSRFRTKRNR